MTELNLTKPVQTRDGRPVRILCTDAPEPRPIVALVSGKDGTDDGVGRWAASGKYDTLGNFNEEFDLVNTPIKRRVTGWLNVYPDGDIYYSRHRTEADGSADKSRIACIPIDIELNEGDGLNEQNK